MTTPADYPRLNALAAEKVMGYHWVQHIYNMDRIILVKPAGHWLKDEYIKGYSDWPGLLHDISHAPQFCTSLTDAEKLCKRVMQNYDDKELDRPYFSVNYDPDRSKDSPWVCRFKDSCERTFTGSGSTEPLARTLACLAVVGVDTESELKKETR